VGVLTPALAVPEAVAVPVVEVGMVMTLLERIKAEAEGVERTRKKAVKVHRSRAVPAVTVRIHRETGATGGTVERSAVAVLAVAKILWPAVTGAEVQAVLSVLL
jgi:hypothetical protein